MRILIKTSVGSGLGESAREYGEFAGTLRRTLEAQGAEVAELSELRRMDTNVADVVIVLGEGVPEPPANGAFRILWLLHPPLRITGRELDSYDLVLTPSELHLGLLRETTKAPVRLGRHCVDTAVFTAPTESIEHEATERAGLVYATDSFGERRPMARWLPASGMTARVFGDGWYRSGIEHMVEATRIEATNRARVAGGAAFGLVDHTRRERASGYVNPRLLEHLACGLPVIVEDLPEVRRLLGDVPIYVDGAERLNGGLREGRERYNELLERVRTTWAQIGGGFTFECRTAEILEWVAHPPPRGHGQRHGGWRVMETLQRATACDEQQVAHLERLLYERELLLQSVQQELQDEHARSAKHLELARMTAAYARRLEQHLADLHESRFWRPTAPLRVVTEWAGALLRGRRGTPASLPERPAGMDALGAEVPSEATANEAKRGSLRIVTFMRRVLPVPVKRGLRTVFARAGITPPGGSYRISGGGSVRRNAASPDADGDADNSSAVSGNADYWRLQALQLLEELESVAITPSDRNSHN